MDYLQYSNWTTVSGKPVYSFKPCYKWITFNTFEDKTISEGELSLSFKPCYKWITFNTSPKHISPCSVFMF